MPIQAYHTHTVFALRAAHSMRNRVYETVKRLSVHLSDRSKQRRAAGLLLSAHRAGDIDRLLHGAPTAGAGVQ